MLGPHAASLQPGFSASHTGGGRAVRMHRHVTGAGRQGLSSRKVHAGSLEQGIPSSSLMDMGFYSAVSKQSIHDPRPSLSCFTFLSATPHPHFSTLASFFLLLFFFLLLSTVSTGTDQGRLCAGLTRGGELWPR